MQISVSLMCLASVVVLGSLNVNGDPDPMARPTRPKVFTSPDDLRRYLDTVKNYYYFTSKARYGKKSDPNMAQQVHDHDYPNNFLKMILALTPQKQLFSEPEDGDKLQLTHSSDPGSTGFYELFE